MLCWHSPTLISQAPHALSWSWLAHKVNKPRPIMTETVAEPCRYLNQVKHGDGSSIRGKSRRHELHRSTRHKNTTIDGLSTTWNTMRNGWMHKNEILHNKSYFTLFQLNVGLAIKSELLCGLQTNCHFSRIMSQNPTKRCNWKRKSKKRFVPHKKEVCILLYHIQNRG